MADWLLILGLFFSMGHALASEPPYRVLTEGPHVSPEKISDADTGRRCSIYLKGEVRSLDEFYLEATLGGEPPAREAMVMALYKNMAVYNGNITFHPAVATYLHYTTIRLEAYGDLARSWKTQIEIPVNNVSYVIFEK